MTDQQQIPPQQTWTPDGPLLPYPGRDPKPPRKRSMLWLWVTLGAVATLVIGALVVYGGPLTPTTHTVTYTAEADSATGSGRTGMITAQTENGGTSQTVVLLPYSGTTTQFHAGDFLYISVQNQQGQGSVTCRITVDGVVVSENTSSGGYTIATCQGSVPK